MSVSPDHDMFSGDAPEFNEQEAIEEISRELAGPGLRLGREEIDTIIRTLLVDPAGIYHGLSEKAEFTVMRGLNGRFLLQLKPRTPESG